MSRDEWSDDDEPSPAAPAHRTGSESRRGCVGAEEARRIARLEVTRGWEAVGVDFATIEKRQEVARLLDWMRERKRAREAGTSKIWTTAVGAVVSALIAGAATFLGGGHR